MTHYKSEIIQSGGQYTVEYGYSDFTLAAGDYIRSKESGIVEDGTWSENSYSIQGEITAANYGMWINGIETVVNIGGTISANFAIYVDPEVSEYSQYYATGSVVINKGTITGETASYTGGWRNEIFTNEGTANGLVSMGAGDDQYIGTGGALNGNLDGDDGNDVLTLTGQALKGSISGGNDNDQLTLANMTVIGDVSGDAGNDMLKLAGVEITGAVSGGMGIDIIELAGVKITGDISGGMGRDEIKLVDVEINGNVSGGEDDGVNDVITISGASHIIGNVSVSGNSAENRITISAASHITGDVLGGEGSERFNVSGTVSGSIIGGAGSDTYNIGDNTSLVLVENAVEGDESRDTVITSASYTLGDNFEVLKLTGKKAINGTGNALDNDISGNKANNILIGGGGNNWLEGDAGDDVLKGGNSYDFLRGGTGHDRLSGGAGEDRLDGGAGRDILTGGKGADHFIFSTGAGRDRVTDFQNGTDILFLAELDGIKNFRDLMQHHVRVSGDDLIIFAGHDQLIVEDTRKSELSASDFLL